MRMAKWQGQTGEVIRENIGRVLVRFDDDRAPMWIIKEIPGLELFEAKPFVTGTKRYGAVIHCAHCRETFTAQTMKVTGQARADYCSNKCRQAAYRQRHDPESAYLVRRQARAQKAASTKRQVKKTTICEHCGETVRYSIAQSTNRRYCSDKCKQAAYRQRLRAPNVTDKQG